MTLNSTIHPTERGGISILPQCGRVLPKVKESGFYPHYIPTDSRVRNPTEEHVTKPHMFNTLSTRITWRDFLLFGYIPTDTCVSTRITERTEY
jgi:hypothetical protein